MRVKGCIYFRDLFIYGLLLTCVPRLVAGDDCRQTIPLPQLQSVSYENAITPDGLEGDFEISFISEWPLRLSWFVREFPVSFLHPRDYYIPEQGNDRFSPSALKTGNKSTFTLSTRRLYLEKPTESVHFRLSVEHPCNTILISSSFVSIERIYLQNEDLPNFVQLLRPRYKIQPGEKLQLHTAIQKPGGFYFARYCFDRYAQRMPGRSLGFHHPLYTSSRYNSTSGNILYWKGYDESDFTFSVNVTYNPWNSKDSGIYFFNFIVDYESRHRSELWRILRIEIITFVNIGERWRSRPAIMVQNQFQSKFNPPLTVRRDEDGFTIVPVEPTSGYFRPSFECVAEASRAPTITVMALRSDGRTPDREISNSSTILSLKTMTSKAFEVDYELAYFSCEGTTSRGLRTSIRFKIVPYRPANIINLSPRYVDVSKSPQSVTVKCTAEGDIKIMRFYKSRGKYSLTFPNFEVVKKSESSIVNQSLDFEITTRIGSGKGRAELTINNIKKFRPINKVYWTFQCYAANDFSIDFNIFSVYKFK